MPSLMYGSSGAHDQQFLNPAFSTGSGLDRRASRSVSEGWTSRRDNRRRSLRHGLQDGADENGSGRPG